VAKVMGKRGKRGKLRPNYTEIKVFSIKIL